MHACCDVCCDVCIDYAHSHENKPLLSGKKGKHTLSLLLASSFSRIWRSASMIRGKKGMDSLELQEVGSSPSTVRTKFLSVRILALPACTSGHPIRSHEWSTSRSPLMRTLHGAASPFFLYIITLVSSLIPHLIPSTHAQTTTLSTKEGDYFPCSCGTTTNVRTDCA